MSRAVGTRADLRATLAVQVDALATAVDAARDRLPDTLLDPLATTVTRARERAGLSADYTVAALAGSTGSGKSSLLNALAGEQIAAPGVLRPTTDRPLAAVWPRPGDGGAGVGTGGGPPGGTSGGAPGHDEPATSAAPGGVQELLDWLDVDLRRDVAATPAPAATASTTDRRPDPDPAPTGLVLLDLPDHDSVEIAHRLRAERLYDRADLLVWVVDPQKYADAALHVRYLRPLAAHADVMVLVLGHADRLTPPERAQCVADLRRLAAEDGLGDVPVLAVSARTGEGVDALRDLLAEAAARRRAAVDRVRADVAAAAGVLLAACGPERPTTQPSPARAELVAALEQAAGVGTVVAAVRRSSARRARLATGWPPTRWLARLRPDPLRRLGLARVPVDAPELVRSSMTAPGPVALAGAATAVRRYVDEATAGVPDAWVLAVRSVADGHGLADRLDQAVVGTPLGATRSPRWWRAVGALQWVWLAVAVAGLVWLGVLAVLGYLQLPVPGTPRWSELPVPTGLVLGGVLAGLLTALLARWAGAWAARRAAARVRRRLHTAVAEVARERVTDPVDAELAAWSACRVAAARALAA
ncbi:GTP-binding protein HSR1 [Cellulomonas hominis]